MLPMAIETTTRIPQNPARGETHRRGAEVRANAPHPDGAAAERTGAIDLLDLDLGGCEALAAGLGYKPFHGRNLFKWIHKHGVTEYAAMTDLSKALRADLEAAAEVRLPRLLHETPSADGTRKWVMALGDGQRVEAVLIPEERRRTLCVSSQVGCALNCSFCATARQGFNRNLSSGEIVGQVWHAARQIGAAPSNIVLMGMGEPLANFDNVVRATRVMQDDLAYMVSKQRVTLSTSGIVPNIHRLRDVSDVSLAVSLHAPNNALRDELVPVNRKYPLEELIPACRAYIGDDRRRRVTWEYVMLDGVNDSLSHARELIRLLEGTRSKVNLIPFNPFPGSGYRTSTPEQVDAFRRRLLRSGLVATVRKTRGDAISAACGQLVGRVRDRTRRQPPAGPDARALAG
jgi:23S rRNA (adenine2503-C2)-methyltransferase